MPHARALNGRGLGRAEAALAAVREAVRSRRGTDFTARARLFRVRREALA